MAVTVTYSNRFKYALMNGDIDFNGDTIKAYLMRDGFSFDIDNHATMINIKTNTGAISITATNSPGKFTRGANSFITDGFVVGNRVTTNSAHAANQGPFKISVLTATEMTVTDMAGAAVTLDIATEPETITITSDDELGSPYANGYSVATLAMTMTGEDDTNNRCDATFATVTWTAAGGNIGPTPGAIIWDDTPAENTLIAYVDFGGNVTAADTDTINIGNGTFRVA